MFGPMTPAKHDRNEAGRQQALADLERLRRQDETLTGSLAAGARRAARRPSPRPPPPPPPNAK